jgi:excisionase family DNA binding protein
MDETARGPEILTASDVAKKLHCSKSQVYKAMNGEIPGVSPLPVISLGRLRRVRRAALEQWIKENERSAQGAMIDPSLKNYAV